MFQATPPNTSVPCFLKGVQKRPCYGSRFRENGSDYYNTQKGRKQLKLLTGETL